MDNVRKQILQRVVEALEHLGFDSSRKQRVFMAGTMGVSYRTAGAWLAQRRFPSNWGKLLQVFGRRGIPSDWFFSDGGEALPEMMASFQRVQATGEAFARLPGVGQSAIDKAAVMLREGKRVQQVQEILDHMQGGSVAWLAGAAQIERIWKYRNLSCTGGASKC